MNTVDIKAERRLLDRRERPSPYPRPATTLRSASKASPSSSRRTLGGDAGLPAASAEAASTFLAHGNCVLDLRLQRGSLSRCENRVDLGCHGHCVVQHLTDLRQEIHAVAAYVVDAAARLEDLLYERLDLFD